MDNIVERTKYVIDIFESCHFDRELYELFQIERDELYNGKSQGQVISGSIVLLGHKDSYSLLIIREECIISGDKLWDWLEIKTEEQFFQKSLIFDFDRLSITFELLQLLQKQFVRLLSIYDRINHNNSLTRL